jgi:glycosyltransferase involved in cell wall biosynthesis
MSDLAVIMSVYKNDKLSYVIQSTQSILNQTFNQFDYYIAFDGQVDADIDKYITSLRDQRIKLFRLDKNNGIARALNFLLDIVLKVPEYKFIARMDADDISLSLRFEKQRNFLLDNPEASCIGCWYEEIDESGKHLADIKLPIDHENLRKRYFTRTPFAHPSVIYRRQLIEKAGFYPTDTILMEDNVLWGRALKEGLKFANIPEYLFRFRIDRDFYKRRSGIKYGLNYIVTKFKINKLLNFPFYTFILSFIIGVYKMMPLIMFRNICLIAKRPV